MIDAGADSDFPVRVAATRAGSGRSRCDRRASRRRLAGLLLATAFGCSGAGEPPQHLLLITVDTLRADRLAAYGGVGGITPHVDAFAETGVVFLRAYAPAAFTLPSLATLMTGRYPQQLGIWKNESGVPEAAETLAEALRARGWRTAAVVSNFVLRESSGIGAGFDLFDDVFPQREAVRKWPERIAADTTDAALATLDGCTPGADAHCFLWVHYQDPHGPYNPPADGRARLLAGARAAPEGERELPRIPESEPFGGIPPYQFMEGRHDVGFYRAGYDAEIVYTDTEVGRLLDGVAARGLAERTLVVFAADHGEALGEGDYWFAHGELLSDVLVRVPLVIRDPGRSPGVRRDPVSLADLRPTLLARLAGEPPTPEGVGRDLLAAGAEAGSSTPYFATLGASSVERYGLVLGDYKLVVSESGGAREESLTRSPAGEPETPLQDPEVASRLRNRLAEMRRAFATGPAEIRQDLTPEDRGQLRALGYTSEP